MATVERHLPVTPLFNLMCGSGAGIVVAPQFEHMNLAQGSIQ